jgi:hypothetical protein
VCLWNWPKKIPERQIQRTMKIVFDVLAGMAACGVACFLALPDPATTSDDGNVRTMPEPGGRSPRLLAPSMPVRGSSAGTLAGSEDGSTAGLTPEQKFSVSMLRNEIVSAVAEDMHRRGESVMNCLAGMRLADTERVRLAVNVVSAALEAVTAQWRFVEIAEGEPLPDSFGSCAEHALGGNQHIVAPAGFHFPDYHGQLLFLYTIPASDGGASADDGHK